RPIIEDRMVDEIGEAVAAGQTRQTHPHSLSGKGRLQPSYIGETRERVEKAAKAGEQQADIDALRDKRRRQCRGDIAEPARLDPRVELGRDVKDTHSGQRERCLFILIRFPASKNRSCPLPNCSASPSSALRRTKSSP